MRAIGNATLVFLLVAPSTPLAEIQTRATREQASKMTIVGPPLPVSSLRELWDLSPVVVLGTVKENGAAQANASGDVLRHQVVRVVSVLKDTTAAVQDATDLRISYLGGTVKVNGQEHNTSYSPPPPQPGAEIVCFLERGDTDGVFVLTRGATSLFEVGSSPHQMIRVSQAASRMPELGGRRDIPREELLRLLGDFMNGR